MSTATDGVWDGMPLLTGYALTFMSLHSSPFPFEASKATSRSLISPKNVRVFQHGAELCKRNHARGSAIDHPGFAPNKTYGCRKPLKVNGSLESDPDFVALGSNQDVQFGVFHYDISLGNMDTRNASAGVDAECAEGESGSRTGVSVNRYPAPENDSVRVAPCRRRSRIQTAIDLAPSPWHTWIPRRVQPRLS